MGKKEFDFSVFIKFLSGTSTAKEAESIVQYLEKDRDNRHIYFHLKRIWLEGNKRFREPKLIDNSWERLNIRMDESENKKRPTRKPGFRFLWRRLAVAASIAILLGTSGYLGYQKYQISTSRDNELTVNAPPGSRSRILLPDGSTVWLNSSSSLTYNYNFEKTGREVSLVGEAFFDIKHLGKTSFIVNTSDLKIRVLGTRFNVKSYPDEQVIETTLVKGKIEVDKINDEKTDRPIVMTPNQRLIYTKKGRAVELDPVTDKKVEVVDTDIEALKQKNIRIIKNIDPQEDSSWKDGKLIIKNESLGILARKLERYYNVNITFQDDSIKQYTYSGTLEEVTIEEVLRALERTSPIQFNVNRNQIIIISKNNK